MAARTFAYKFSPRRLDPLGGGATVALDVDDIERAGIREVLQAPGANLASWTILDALLTPTGPNSPFVFLQPLGQAREVKVALSGLFGRFVARAYLEQFFQLSVFAHLGGATLSLRGQRIRVVRRAPGDLPDWVCCQPGLSNLTIAEAKGSHQSSGPSSTLQRAWAQAQRVNVTVNGRRAPLKRVAIATRWGTAVGGPATPMISVRDPEEDGDEVQQEELAPLYVDLLRIHVANLLTPLGHPLLAGALRDLATEGDKSEVVSRARSALDRSLVGEFDDDANDLGGLVGGVVTRAGVLDEQRPSADQQRALSSLNFRPVFVGVELNIIKALLDEDSMLVRKELARGRHPTNSGHPDGAGGWIVRLGKESLLA